MKSMQLIKKISALLTSSAMLLAFSSVLPEQNHASATSEVVIRMDKEYQTIRGFGGMNLPEWTGSDLSDAQRQKAFGNGADELGLTVLRVFVNPNKNQWNIALPTAQFASKMGATVFATPWEPPANLAEKYPDSKIGKLHLPKSNYGAYAKHLNDFGTYMKNNGVDLYSISVQNEPDYSSEWTHWTTDETTDFLANYGDQITSTRLMSPESFQYSPEGASWIDHGTGDGGKRIYKKILNNPKAFANCDLFGTHYYGTSRQWMDYPELENCGKEIWMTEVYVPNSDQDSANRFPEALKVSENIHNGLVVGNLSAYTWWYIRRHYGLMTDDGKISKRGYCMAQYSKYVRPGDVRIDATEQPADNVYVSAYKNNAGQVKIVAVNMGTENYSQQFSITNGKQIAKIDRYRTSGSENLAKTENLEYNGNSFWAQIPAQSVSTFVISTSEKAVEPDKNGYYFHDTFESDNCDWQAHGTSELTLSGRIPYQGTNALLIKNREKSWHGTEKALNPQAFQAGKEYSFSVCLNYMDGDDTKNVALSLQYTDSSGELKFARIASAVAYKGNYVQIANPSFKLPEGGKDFVIYVETENGTDNFYIDEAIGAVKGTVIQGPPVVTTTTTTTTTTTKATTTTTTIKVTAQPKTTTTTKTIPSTTSTVVTTTTASATTEKPATTTTAAETTVVTEATTLETTTVTENTTVTVTAPAATTTATEKAADTTTEAATTLATQIQTTETTAATSIEIPITEVLYGDINLDGKVELVDAILLNKACAGQVTLSAEANKNGDCDNSGNTDTSDAIVLLQFLVHLIDQLPWAQ